MCSAQQGQAETPTLITPMARWAPPCFTPSPGSAPWAAPRLRPMSHESFSRGNRARLSPPRLITLMAETPRLITPMTAWAPPCSAPPVRVPSPLQPPPCPAGAGPRCPRPVRRGRSRPAPIALPGLSRTSGRGRARQAHGAAAPGLALLGTGGAERRAPGTAAGERGWGCGDQHCGTGGTGNADGKRPGPGPRSVRPRSSSGRRVGGGPGGVSGPGPGGSAGKRRDGAGWGCGRSGRGESAGGAGEAGRECGKSGPGAGEANGRCQGPGGVAGGAGAGTRLQPPGRGGNRAEGAGGTGLEVGDKPGWGTRWEPEVAELLEPAGTGTPSQRGAGGSCPHPGPGGCPVQRGPRETAGPRP